jgi:tetratricopeptide (TPR) repeat protein
VATGYHQLGIVAQLRGRLDDAEDWYQRSLTIEEELGNQPGMATSYHQLGIVAQLRGRLDDAEDWYRCSLTIEEELGNRPGMALTYGQLGLLAEARGNAGQALRLMVQCVALFDAFPHPATGPAPGHLVRLTRQLGIDALKDAWLDVTSNDIPAAVLQTVEQALRDHDEESP